MVSVILWDVCGIRPPFGHIAEAVLSDLMRDLGGFEGNAQSFRIVTKLAVRTKDPRGLNLTRAVLDGILKYPRLRENVPPDGTPLTVSWTDRSRGGKWGAYRSETEEYEHARNIPARASARSSQEEGNYPSGVRSVAAIIMDWADGIAFATHDIDDYFRAWLDSIAGS